MGDTPAITFPASVYKVQTLVDGGIRITLDLPETAIPQAAMLMECKREGIPLLFEATAISLTILDDETKKDAEGTNLKVDRRRSTNRRDKR